MKVGLCLTKLAGHYMYSLHPKLCAGFPNRGQSFEQVLRNVVFADGRPGAGHVEVGRFIIRSVKDGAPLNSHTWKSAVQEGAHLTQAMVLSKTKDSPRKCLFADCVGALQSDGNCWLVKPFFFSLILRNLFDFTLNLLSC